MNLIVTTFQYLKHRLQAKRWDSFHSPYLFRLFTSCCDDTNDATAYSEIEKKRIEFKNSAETIERKDHGAGSLVSGSGKQQKIAFIARHALSRPFQCRFLARLAQFTQAKTIIEFGSSLGISAAYLSIGRPEAQVITVEGDPELAKRSKKVFKELGLTNTQIVEATFEAFLSTEINTISSIDLLFLDGNHQSRALLSYYHALKHLFTPDTIIIVDDIYWSRDMKDGWSTLIALPEIKQSVDCYQFGLLFFNHDFIQKENHIIRLPWRSVYD